MDKIEAKIAKLKAKYTKQAKRKIKIEQRADSEFYVCENIGMYKWCKK